MEVVGTRDFSYSTKKYKRRTKLSCQNFRFSTILVGCEMYPSVVVQSLDIVSFLPPLEKHNRQKFPFAQEITCQDKLIIFFFKRGFYVGNVVPIFWVITLEVGTNFEIFRALQLQKYPQCTKSHTNYTIFLTSENHPWRS